MSEINCDENVHYDIIINGGGKLYKCRICDLICMIKPRIENHVSKHLNKKSYKCEICVCSFRDKTGYTGHTESKKHIKNSQE